MSNYCILKFTFIILLLFAPIHLGCDKSSRVDVNSSSQSDSDNQTTQHDPVNDYYSLYSTMFDSIIQAIDCYLLINDPDPGEFSPDSVLYLRFDKDFLDVNITTSGIHSSFSVFDKSRNYLFENDVTEGILFSIYNNHYSEYNAVGFTDISYEDWLQVYHFGSPISQVFLLHIWYYS